MDTWVSGTPRLLLRAEGAVVLVASVVAYQAIGGSWWMFALLLLVPDVGLAGYLVSARAGALSYNACHTYIGPGLLALVAYVRELDGLWPLCLIWTAHLGMDRALGLGLKFATAFGNTHLGFVGRQART